MRTLIKLFLMFTILSCGAPGSGNADPQIWNKILNYEIALVQPCEQYADDYFSGENLPEGMAIAVSPPFDSLPCITQISINNTVTREFLDRQCIVLQFRNTLSDLESHLDPESLHRANVYLQNEYHQLAGMDLTRLDITRAGMHVTENAADCERKHTSIYEFSPVLLNQQGDKAVVFLYQRGHAEQRAAYFLKKIGEIWFLEIKEMM